MITFIHDHEELLFWLITVSIIGLIVSLVLIPWMLIQIPQDYFSHKKRQKYRLRNKPPIVRFLFFLIKNIFGIIFIISGIIMLFIPGQGIVTIIMGTILTDFPYKYKIERWIIKHPKILRPINQLRKKAKKEPLEV